MIEKILFPTKFRELAYDSLETLFPLKESGLKEIVFLHVILREDVGFVPFGGYMKDEEKRLVEEARIRFDDWQASLRERGIKSKTIIKVGEPVHEMLIAAKEEKVDMIIVGRKKRIDIEYNFIGSYTNEIISRCTFPLMVSKYMVEYKHENATLTKINENPFEIPLLVVGTSSEISERIVEFMKGFCGVVKKAYVFWDIEAKEMSGKEASEVTDLEEKCLAQCRVYCESLRSAGIDAEPHLGAGDMLDEVLRVSRERKASMIVIGNEHKHPFLEQIFHRSLTYKVTKMSELPTLLVP